jgi:hypothetical protein
MGNSDLEWSGSQTDQKTTENDLKTSLHPEKMLIREQVSALIGNTRSGEKFWLTGILKKKRVKRGYGHKS